ncbi:MAG: O-antigen ligase family protein [Candidatus Avelusimicrobium sp.]|uniref:O-antigen ligase family protein n=1 Tax=Candidatus Avelusimicrobium sp. TaxID=3048833 RepID=UPI003F0E3C5D
MSAKHIKKNTSKNNSAKTAVPAPNSFERFVRGTLVHGTGILTLLVSISFFTATYDSAQVKLTLLHAGGLVLLALWTSLCLVRKKFPFTRQNVMFLLPVFAYLAWNTLSFLLFPYKMEAAEEFFRFWLYGGLTLLAATEFTLEDVCTLVKYVVTAAWISFAYGALQVLDGFFQGIDPMPWRGFFTKRVFSTHANPNFYADFVIFSSCLAGAGYLVSRKKSLLFLLGTGAVTLFFTESKGAWVAYAAAAACAAALYTNCLAQAAKKHLKKINLVAAVLLLAAVVLAGGFALKRFQSVSFRAYTWLSVFEMVQDAPVLGTGAGSFKIIYSAYRRPQIFYIENAHNIETQHAENEFLEQWATGGTVGLAVFLWLVLFLLVLAVKNLKRTGADDALRERNIYLLGITAAFTGMILHAGVDISIHFASSGLFLALFMGMIIALCAPREEQIPISEGKISVWVWFLRATVWGTLVWLVCRLFGEFYEINAVVRVTNLGQFLLEACAWTVFSACVLGTSYVYARAAKLCSSPRALAVLLLSLLPVYGVWGFFRANHYYSLGVSMVNARNAEGALGYFTKAIRLNPFQTEYRQFRANTMAVTFNLTKTFSPARGDEQTMSDDFERALKDLDTVAARSPNHPLVYHNYGQLYFTMAMRRSQDASQAKSQAEYEMFRNEAVKNMERAKKAFERALLADPVNPQTYFYLTQIALLERDGKTALEWINRYRQGPQGVTEEEFLKTNRTNPIFKPLEQQARALTYRR